MPMGAIESSPIGVSHVHVEGQVMHHFNSETPAEKAKKRTSMAERMIDPESMQVRASPAKGKNKDSAELLRLSSGVLGMHG